MDNKLGYLADVLKTLHDKWTPHDGQITVGQALFKEGKKRIFVQCGRKWGKSEFLIYTLVRWAMLNSNSQCYYFAPYQKQAREILWVRLKQFIPREWIADENKTEGRITLTSGSFIKIDGSDNYESFRGITPDIVAYDEFKDFRPEFHVAMEPNLGPRKAPLLIVGTPPDYDGQYTELADEIRADKGEGFWIEASSYENPYNDKKWLDQMKGKLIARGEPDVWEREYLGRYIKGGSRSIFPMLKKPLHVMEYKALKSELRRDLHKLQWYMVVDPGTTSVFAGLIAAVHPYNRKIYLFDEIYVTQAAQATTGQVWPLLSARALEANPHNLPGSHEWFRIYDEAAAWFNMESIDRFSVGWSPTQKAANAKEVGLGLIKDLLQDHLLVMTDRCEKLFWEMENYALDQNGRIPKRNDHLIDCLRYLLHAANYSIIKRAEPVPQPKEEGRRAFTMEQDFAADKTDLPDDHYD